MITIYARTQTELNSMIDAKISEGFKPVRVYANVETTNGKMWACILTK